MPKVILAALLLLSSQAARAEWLQASSAHFVIYADDSENDVRRFADQLERYHAAMALVSSGDLPTPSPSNRVTVFVVRSEGEVRRLYGKDSRYVGGFYIPRAGGSLAFVPRVDAAHGEAQWSMIALLHEYAHHFQISSSSFPIPRWLSEGSAEFFASAGFDADGSVWIGRPAQHRAGELFYAQEVKAADLLDPDAYEAHHRTGYDAFYGKSWLLYHYLVFDEARKGQLEKYISGLVAGKSQREAALAAFGDFDALERDLDHYLHAPRMHALHIAASLLHAAPVTVRRLSEGEAAMMPIRVRSSRGVDEDQAKALVTEARAVAARYPGDAAVLSALAEAEYDSGNDAQAIAAADAALAIDKTQVNAYVQKGYAMFRQAETSSDPEAFVKARAPFIQLNRIENDHPLPLLYYYYSFVRSGREPTKLAVDGLERAASLAPFDLGLRMATAMQEIHDKHLEAARRNLRPVAYSPHGDELSEAARNVLDRLDQDPTWDGSGDPKDLQAAGPAGQAVSGK